MKRLQGYISSREIAENFIPQRVQNLVIRDYCNGAGYEYLLSATEYYMEDCYFMLDSLQSESEDFDGIVFYSMEQFPREKEKVEGILQSFLNSEKEVHFALERVRISTLEELSSTLDMILIKDLRKVKLEGLI